MEKRNERKHLLRDIHQIQEWIIDLEKSGSTFPWSKETIEKNALLLGMVLNFLPNPFYVIDASDFRVIAANSAAQFSRLSKNSTCYALTHKTDRPCDSTSHPCPVEKIKETKQPVIVEHLHYDKDGNPRNVEVHAFPVFDREWNVSHIIEYTLDITARKQAEDRLKGELAVKSALSLLYEPLTSPMASIEAITRIVLEQAKLLSRSDEGYVSEIDPETGNNVLHSFTKIVKDRNGATGRSRKNSIPRGEDGQCLSLWGHSINTGKAYYSNSPKDPESSIEIFNRAVAIHRFVSVPVMLGEELVGEIALANKKKDYMERDLNAIRRLSEFYALAIQRIRTEDKLKKAHEELERRIEERTNELEKSCEERALIREIFGTYISDEVAAKILNSPDGLNLGGETREMSVLVSDLRDFSGIIESMKASDVVTLINRYLEKMVHIILTHEGTIDEFTGDGILVFFGAPRTLPDHHKRAVVCALDMQKSMKQLNEENRSLGLPQLGMGIGISCGQLIVGNIGAEKRKKYGAVGTPIISAFRLEKKARPGEVLITETVKNKIGGLLEVGTHWKENLKGVGDTVLYQAIGLKREI